MPDLRKQWIGEHMARYETGAIYTVNPNVDTNVPNLLYDNTMSLVWTENFPNVCTFRRKDIIGISCTFARYFEYVEFCDDYIILSSQYNIPCISDFVVGIELPKGVQYDLSIGGVVIGKFSENNMMIPLFGSFQKISVKLYDKSGVQNKNTKMTVRYRTIAHSDEFAQKYLYNSIYFKNDQGDIFCMRDGSVTLVTGRAIPKQLVLLNNTTPHNQPIGVYSKLFMLIVRNYENPSILEHFLKNYIKTLLSMKDTEKILISIWSGVFRECPDVDIHLGKFSTSGNSEEMIRLVLTDILEANKDKHFRLQMCLSSIPMLSVEQANFMCTVIADSL